MLIQTENSLPFAEKIDYINVNAKVCMLII